MVGSYRVVDISIACEVTSILLTILSPENKRVLLAHLPDGVTTCCGYPIEKPWQQIRRAQMKGGVRKNLMIGSTPLNLEGPLSCCQDAMDHGGHLEFKAMPVMMRATMHAIQKSDQMADRRPSVFWMANP